MKEHITILNYKYFKIWNEGNKNSKYNKQAFLIIDIK